MGPTWINLLTNASSSPRGGGQGILSFFTILHVSLVGMHTCMVSLLQGMRKNPVWFVRCYMGSWSVCALGRRNKCRIILCRLCGGEYKEDKKE